MSDVVYAPQKVLVLGNSSVGKSSLISRYVNDKFDSKYLTTLGADMAVKSLNLKDGSTLRLHLWDIAGQERFGQLTRSYYKDAHAAIIVFDLTQPASLTDIERWRLELVDKVLKPDGTPVPILLVGNKADLKDQRRVTREEIEKAKQSEGRKSWLWGELERLIVGVTGVIAFAETSAKTGQGVDAAFEYIANKLLETMTALDGADDEQDRGTVQLKQVVSSRKQDKGGCC
eukprot:m.53757 g.53757  ORF g.53757 m.53757 type:complete len:230 (-) comp13581_c0_seq1:1332-2021(-)